MDLDLHQIVKNQYNKVAQMGNVIIEDHVEIGCKYYRRQSDVGSTIIRKGVKLDNHTDSAQCRDRRKYSDCCADRCCRIY